jgi:pyridinium-3,5-biscarboxylic acid mononucleotide sulfurtransferase
MLSKSDPKYNQLIHYLTNLGDAAIAFSGGVDSTFLLKAAHEALGKKVLALTIRTPYIPDWEINESKDFATKLGVKHVVVEIPMDDDILNNPENRCYLCKMILFKKLREIVIANGFKHLLDGTNYDDSADNRPGMKALKELNILSPLRDNGFTKKDIRSYSRINNLPTWEKPAYACLLTRIPYNTHIENEQLRRIEKAEKFLIDLGIKAIRVRVHGDLARIETEPILMNKIFEENLFKTISEKLKDIGFKYVTLDLEGYRENK